MFTLKAGSLPVFLLNVIIFTACTGTGDGNLNSVNTATGPSNRSVAKTNVEELGMLINVPYETDEAVWREDPVTGAAAGNSAPAGATKKLTAVMKLSAEDAEKLTKSAEEKRPPSQAELAVETWFPNELIAQSELSGNDTVKGRSYAADEFFLQPYSDGRITRIDDTNYFILELYSGQPVR